MAKYVFFGTITVVSSSKTEAINSLQAMLDDYEDNNPNVAPIAIHYDKIQKVVE